MSEQALPPIFPTIGSIMGAGLAISTAIWRDRPKISKIEDLGTVINYTNNMQVSEQRYYLKWGTIDHSHFPPWRTINGDGKFESIFNSLFLIEIPKNASIEFYYFRFGKLEDELSSIAYKIVDNPWDENNKVYLRSRKFYLKNKITNIFAVVKTKISVDYQSQIRHFIHDDHIEIINRNYFKIINYEIELPYVITMNRIDRASPFVDIVERIPDDTSTTGEHLKLIIKEIPARQVDLPGKIKIPFIPLS